MRKQKFKRDELYRDLVDGAENTYEKYVLKNSVEDVEFECDKFQGGGGVKCTFVFERLEDNTFWSIVFWVSSDYDCHDLRRDSYHDEGEFIEATQVEEVQILRTEYITLK